MTGIVFIWYVSYGLVLTKDKGLVIVTLQAHRK